MSFRTGSFAEAGVVAVTQKPLGLNGLIVSFELSIFFLQEDVSSFHCQQEVPDTDARLILANPLFCSRLSGVGLGLGEGGLMSLSFPLRPFALLGTRTGSGLFCFLCFAAFITSSVELGPCCMQLAEDCREQDPPSWPPPQSSSRVCTPPSLEHSFCPSQESMAMLLA